MDTAPPDCLRCPDNIFWDGGFTCRLLASRREATHTSFAPDPRRGWLPAWARVWGSPQRCSSVESHLRTQRTRCPNSFCSPARKKPGLRRRDITRSTSSWWVAVVGLRSTAFQGAAVLCSCGGICQYSPASSARLVLAKEARSTKKSWSLAPAVAQRRTWIANSMWRSPVLPAAAVGAVPRQVAMAERLMQVLGGTQNPPAPVAARVRRPWAMALGAFQVTLNSAEPAALGLRAAAGAAPRKRPVAPQ